MKNQQKLTDKEYKEQHDKILFALVESLTVFAVIIVLILFFRFTI